MSVIERFYVSDDVEVKTMKHVLRCERNNVYLQELYNFPSFDVFFHCVFPPPKELKSFLVVFTVTEMHVCTIHYLTASEFAISVGCLN